MLVVLHANQLEHIVERTIIKNFNCHPKSLTIDSRYFVKGQRNWEVSAHFDKGGMRCRVNLNIDPETGRVIHCSMENLDTT